MEDSAAEVVYQFLQDQGLLDDVGGDWPAYISFLPENPNDAAAVYDTAGIDDGRIMQGPQIEHPGIQVVVRSTIYSDGWDKARAIADALDDQVKSVVVLDDGATYILHNVSRRGNVIPVGIDPSDVIRRHYFTINAAVTYAFLEQQTGFFRLLDDTNFARLLDDTEFELELE